ncbi:MAG: Stf0 family sulfotransferase, partial [Desulfovermiculus sp.]
WLGGGGAQNVRKYLQTCFQYRTTQDGVFTCKAHWNQFQPFLKKGVLQEYFAGARFVLIRRRDLLSQAISYEIATQTGQWSSNWSKGREPEYSRQAITKKMQSIISQNANWRLFFARNAINWQEVVYEDMLANPEDTIQRAVDHLVPELEITAQAELSTSGLKKQGNDLNTQWKERFIQESGEWQKAAEMDAQA